MKLSLFVQQSLLFMATWLFLLPLSVPAQNIQTPNRADYVLHIKKAQGAFVIDGVLDEPDWQQAQTVGDFYRVLPIDTGYATTPTEVRMSYDERNLYFGITCYERDAGANITDVIKTVIYVTDIDNWEAIGQAHGEFFRNIRPVSTMVEVNSLIGTDFLVEIEARAIIND